MHGMGMRGMGVHYAGVHCVVVHCVKTSKTLTDTVDLPLTLIRAAGGVYDFRNFEQI
jgi:hypothetical protein